MSEVESKAFPFSIRQLNYLLLLSQGHPLIVIASNVLLAYSPSSFGSSTRMALVGRVEGMTTAPLLIQQLNDIMERNQAVLVAERADRWVKLRFCYSAQIVRIQFFSCWTNRGVSTYKKCNLKDSTTVLILSIIHAPDIQALWVFAYLWLFAIVVTSSTSLK